VRFDVGEGIRLFYDVVGSGLAADRRGNDREADAAAPARRAGLLLDDCGQGTFRDQPERTEAVLREFLA
jgi:hypothetical protein